MKHGMTVEYLKRRADPNFQVDFGVNGAIGTIMTSGILFYLDNRLFAELSKINQESIMVGECRCGDSILG